MYKIYLAIRYLIRRRIALAAVGSVALCIVLMIVITSLFNGFMDLFDDYWHHEYGQVALVPYGAEIDYSDLANYLESQPEIAYVRMDADAGGLLFLNNGNVRQVVIKGIDLQRELQTEHFGNGLLNLHTGDEGFTLSQSQNQKAEEWLENKLGIELTDEDRPAATPCILSVGLLGDPDPKTDKYDNSAISTEIAEWKRPAFIFTGEASSDKDGMQYKKKNLRCWPIDAIQTGSQHLDENVVYLPFDYVVSEFGTFGKLMIVGNGDLNDQELASHVKEYWLQYKIDKHWDSYIDNDLSLGAAKAEITIPGEYPWLKMFIREIKKQLATMQVILAIVCLVASVLIFVILMMLVLQKRRDIGIIRACGGSRNSIATLFLYYGLSIGISGTIIGLLCGWFVVVNIETLEQILSTILGFKIWKAGSYGFSQIPNWVHIGSLWWICCAGVLTASLGAFIPALKAARTQPAESLRHE